MNFILYLCRLEENGLWDLRLMGVLAKGFLFCSFQLLTKTTCLRYGSKCNIHNLEQTQFFIVFFNYFFSRDFSQ